MGIFAVKAFVHDKKALPREAADLASFAAWSVGRPMILQCSRPLDASQPRGLLGQISASFKWALNPSGGSLQAFSKDRPCHSPFNQGQEGGIAQSLRSLCLEERHTCKSRRLSTFDLRWLKWNVATRERRNRQRHLDFRFHRIFHS
jgi:hypothetical protein